MPRVTVAEKLRRRQRIEGLLAEGAESSLAIAAKLQAEGFDVSDRQVRDDMALVAREWRESIVRLRHVRQMRLVRNAERRNAELQAEWERSKKDKERKRARTRKKTAGEGEAGAGGEGVPFEQQTEAEQATEGRVGAVALMTEQRRNDEFIAELLGAKEATKHEHTGRDGSPIEFVEVPGDPAAGGGG